MAKKNLEEKNAASGGGRRKSVLQVMSEPHTEYERSEGSNAVKQRSITRTHTAGMTALSKFKPLRINRSLIAISVPWASAGT